MPPKFESHCPCAATVICPEWVTAGTPGSNSWPRLHSLPLICCFTHCVPDTGFAATPSDIHPRPHPQQPPPLPSLSFWSLLLSFPMHTFWFSFPHALPGTEVSACTQGEQGGWLLSPQLDCPLLQMATVTLWEEPGNLGSAPAWGALSLPGHEGSARSCGAVLSRIFLQLAQCWL